MPDWLVITADPLRGGRGVRGHALTWFLQTYFGRRGVVQLTPAQFRASPVTAETLFIGLPTRLDADELERLIERSRARRIAAFDYGDRHHLAWTEQQEPLLRQAAHSYLKPWFEPNWDFGVRMGLLPLRRFARFTAALGMDRALRRFGVRPTPKYDVAFLGMPNRTRVFVDGRVRKIDQRVDWIQEIKRDAPELSFWGGLLRFGQWDLRRLELIHGKVDDLFHAQPMKSRKVPFPTYWRAIRRSRVLLTPGGNVPWTYRHYEALYAGAAVVANDFRRRNLLVPLPVDGMVHVADGDRVLPAVRQALEWRRSRPTLGEENFAHLEQYLRFGAYHRSRHKLRDRFLAQIG